MSNLFDDFDNVGTGLKFRKFCDEMMTHTAWAQIIVGTWHYQEWCVKELTRYQTYITAEADRTNRLPVEMVKNIRALCAEHDWREYTEMYKTMLRDFS